MLVHAVVTDHDSNHFFHKMHQILLHQILCMELVHMS